LEERQPGAGEFVIMLSDEVERLRILVNSQQGEIKQIRDERDSLKKDNERITGERDRAEVRAMDNVAAYNEVLKQVPDDALTKEQRAWKNATPASTWRKRFGIK
jgi:FtsZ-binding cell division protein ZapB